MRRLSCCIHGLFFLCAWPAGYLQAVQPVAEMEAGRGKWTLKLGYAERRGGEMSAAWRPGLVRERIAQNPLSLTAPRPDLGSLDAYADRTYENGYVFRDEGTEDPLSFTPGQTWYWGYDEAEQYDGRSVSFQSAAYTDMRIEPLQLAEQVAEEDFDQQGFDVALQASLWQRETIEVGLAVGLTLYGNRSFSMQVEQPWDIDTRVTRQLVDTYEAPFLPFPAAGHAGDLAGPGYLLNNIPASREEVELGRRVRTGTVRSSMEVEFDLLEIRVGPTLSWTPHPRYGLAFLPSLRLAHADVRAQTRTQVVPAAASPASYEETRRERTWIPGYGLSAEIYAFVFGPWRMHVAAGFDGWDDDLALLANPFELAFKLGEWNVNVGVGRVW